MSTTTDDALCSALKEAFDNLVALIEHAEKSGISLSIHPDVSIHGPGPSIDGFHLVGGRVTVTKTFNLG